MLAASAMRPAGNKLVIHELNCLQGSVADCDAITVHFLLVGIVNLNQLLACKTERSTAVDLRTNGLFFGTQQHKTSSCGCTTRRDPKMERPHKTLPKVSNAKKGGWLCFAIVVPRLQYSQRRHIQTVKRTRDAKKYPTASNPGEM